MAEKKPEAAAAPAAAPKKNMMVIIIAVVVALVLGGGVAFFLLKKGSHPAEGEEGEEPAAPAAAEHKPAGGHAALPVFVKLEPFTVKLSSEGQDAYLQVGPEMRVLTAEIGDRIKAYMPEIRHKVLLILSAKKAAELGTPQGVQKLSDEMRMTINKILVPPPPPPKKSKKKGKEAEPEVEPEATTLDITPVEPDDPVQAVLFTSFIIQ